MFSGRKMERSSFETMSDWEEDDDFPEVAPQPPPTGSSSFKKENQTRGRGFTPFGGDYAKSCYSFDCGSSSFKSSERECGGYKGIKRGGSRGGSRSRGPGDRSITKGCFKCGEEGHLARDCPQGSDANRNEKKEGRGCLKCGEEGHISRDCPQGYDANRNGKEDGKGCFKCGEEGHLSCDCPQSSDANSKGPAGEDGKPRSLYIPTDIDDSQLFEQGVNAGVNFEKYGSIPVQVTGDDPILPPFTDFNETGLRNVLLDNVAKAGYKIPTPIQKYAIPNIKIGRDLMGCAQTGSGKTAAFLLPILHYILENECQTSDGTDMTEPTAIIVAPTRELAIQIQCEARKFAIGSYLRCLVAYGGTSVGHQLRQIENGCHVLVATPGRLLDFIQRGKVGLRKLKFFVMDEADRMLDLGFMPDVKKIVYNKSMPAKGERQTIMFSATFPVEVQNLAAEFLKDHVYIVVGMVGAANVDVRQKIFLTPMVEKREALVEHLKNILKNDPGEKTLVFVETKRTADFIASYLCLQELSATSIHGDRLQAQREEALAQFKTGMRSILVATAVAARGLDIRGVGYVINYDLPKSVDEYVHRIGRTGRVGNLGISISFYDECADAPLAKNLVKILNDAEQEVPEWLMTAANTSGYAQTYHGQGQFSNRDMRRDKASFSSLKKCGEFDEGTWGSSSSSYPGASIGYTEPLSAGLGDEDESWD